MDAISLDPIILRVDLHLRHHVVEFHVLLANLPAVLDGCDSLLQTVGGNRAAGDGGFGDEEDGG